MFLGLRFCDRRDRTLRRAGWLTTLPTPPTAAFSAELIFKYRNVCFFFFARRPRVLGRAVPWQQHVRCFSGPPSSRLKSDVMLALAGSSLHHTLAIAARCTFTNESPVHSRAFQLALYRAHIF
jgi:hypothetical protein